MNPAVWITIAFVIVLAINFASVKAFGEFEFWLSSIKIIILSGAIILMLVLALGGGPGWVISPDEKTTTLIKKK